MSFTCRRGHASLILNSWMQWSLHKKMDNEWIDVQDQLPPDGEVVWVCTFCRDAIGRMTPPYFQCVAHFYRAKGWDHAFGFPGEVHYWKPKPQDPPLPQWYLLEKEKNG